MTTSANSTLTAVEQAFKAIVWDPMVKAGEIWIAGAEAGIPVLDFPIVQGIEDHIIEALTDYCFQQLVLFVDVTYIKLKNESMQSSWAGAAESLSIIAQEKGLGSDEWKKALATAASDFSQWVHTGP